MKKTISIICAAAIALGCFAGCGGTPKKVTVTTADDLKTLKVGCQNGTTGETWLLDNIEGEPMSYKSGMDAALELKNGKIDAILIDELPAKSIVAQNDDLEIVKLPFDKEEYAIAVAKGNEELVGAINLTIEEMKSNGEYDKLTDAFMPAGGEIVIPDDIVTEGEKTLRMGTNAAFAPFEYVDGDKIVGFDISMSQNIAKTVGAKLEVVNMEFDSLVAALQAGTIDMIAAGMSATEERKQSVDFSDTYYESQQVVIVKK